MEEYSAQGPHKKQLAILRIRLHAVIQTLRIMFWAIQLGLQHNYISIWQHTNEFRRGIVYAFTNTVLTPRCMSAVKVNAVPKHTPKMWGNKQRTGGPLINIPISNSIPRICDNSITTKNL